MAVSYDEKWLALGEEENGGLSIWDLRTRQEIVRLPAGGGEVQVAFSPREPLLAFSMETDPPGTNHQDNIRLWNGATKQIVTQLPLGGLCVGLEFSSDGRTLITSTANPDHQITLWRVPEGRKLAAFPAPQQWSGGTPLAVAPDLSAAPPAKPPGQLRVLRFGPRKGRLSG